MSSTLHGLVEAQADRTPDAVALAFEQHQLSYGELNRRANQIAHYLRRRGVQPETPVAICMSRSLDVVAGILGILKAGGAFVPLDPVYPPDRLGFMLEDTGAPTLLSREPMPWVSERGIQAVSLDRDQALIESASLPLCSEPTCYRRLLCGIVTLPLDSRLPFSVQQLIPCSSSQ